MSIADSQAEGANKSRRRTTVRRISGVVWALCTLGTLATSADGQMYADSIRDYSGVQGQDGWFYGFYAGPFNPSAFQPLPLFGVYGFNEWSRSCDCSGGYWTKCGPNDGGHPNGVNGNNTRLRELNWTVRRWISSVSGPARLTARIRKENLNPCCNGVSGHLFVNQAEVWTTTIAATDGVGTAFTQELCLSEGDVIDFALDPIGDDGSDGSYFGFTVRGPITTQPAPESACVSGTATFSVTTGGTAPLSYHWRKNAVPVNPLQNPTAATATLVLTNVQSVDVGSYDCIVTNACGSVTSEPATLTVCAADFNCSSSLSVQNIFDFLAAYFGGDPRADFNASGAISVQDIFDFLAAWFQGC